MLVVVFRELGAAAGHLLRRDGGQRLLGQLQAAHDGLKALEGERWVVVVHLDDSTWHTSTHNMQKGLFNEFDTTVYMKLSLI